ncbi:DUF456 domain-containing protein [Marinicrinis lubricantis]|uniref:DUF456 domain-containing protein n=1 Tax=Marinicrinis lubricantis TaxID=2086470 RepID=A0ABW1IV98_9BACL
MEIVAWIIVIALLAVGMAGAVFPILPGVLAIYAAFFVYGFMISFDPFGFWFWFIQTVFLVAIFIADYVVSAKSVTKYGGSRASVVGSTIGILIGPFVIPVAGLVIGPFLGAVMGELLHKPDFRSALKVGWGSLIGLLSSTVMKIVLQMLMIVIFVVWIIWG